MPTLAVGLTALLMLVAMKRWAPNVPAALVGGRRGHRRLVGMGFQSMGIDVVGVIPRTSFFSAPSWRMGRGSINCSPLL